MRRLIDAPRLDAFLRRLGDEAREPARVYLTGGATAVLLGWRASTVDVDLKLVPVADRLLRALPALKEELEINVELASPPDFIPPLPGWEGRSAFVARHGSIDFYHFDLYSQALAKLERGHDKDLGDVRAMVGRGLIQPARALELFAAIEPELYRYPAIDPASFRRRVEAEFLARP
jgi:hypothetical protein